MKSKTIIRCVMSATVLFTQFYLCSAMSYAEEETLTKQQQPAESLPSDEDTTFVIQEGLYELRDPIEGWNRGVFAFNDAVDVYFLEPVASGYDYVVPNGVQNSVSNFFSNLEYPVRLFSGIVRFDAADVWVHTQRFFLNSTLGFAGLFDVATDLGIETRPDDVGLALAAYDVGFGPYIVIPFIGPSSARDFFGFAVERAVLSPVRYLYGTSVMDNSELLIVDISLTALEVVNTRSRLLEAIEAGKEASMDFYSFAQGAYFQRRVAAIKAMRGDLELDIEVDDPEWLQDEPDFIEE